MNRGIRSYTEARFVALLPKRETLGDTGFRKKVMDAAIAKFGISIASAATAYNNVLQAMKVENPRAVAGLGRNPTSKTSKAITDLVTVIKARGGDLVVAGVPRKTAVDLCAASGVKGRPKLVIQEDLEELEEE